MPNEAQILFQQGASRSLAAVQQEQRARKLGDIDIKLLADLAWTRSTTLQVGDPAAAQEWIEVALAGYRFLEKNADPALAESAHENVEMLESVGR